MLFKRYEREVRTKRSKDDVIRSLEERASVHDDKFRISSKRFSLYRGSFVVGKIRHDEGITTVSYRISASSDFRAGAYLCLFGGTIISAVLLITQIRHSQVDTKIFVLWTLATLTFWVVFYLLLRVMFRFSAYLQEKSLEQFIKEGR